MSVFLVYSKTFAMLQSSLSRLPIVGVEVETIFSARKITLKWTLADAGYGVRCKIMKLARGELCKT